MDIRELIDDPETTIREAILGFLGDVMTIYPVVIESFDPLTSTCIAKVQLSFQVTQPTGEWQAAQPDAIIKCPVVFISGAGFTMLAPPQPGDEALGLFACKSIDQWWYYSGVQQRIDLRTHHLNDCFILAGVRSRPNALPNVNPAAFEIRSKDGLTKITLDATGVHITAPTITLNGAVVINGQVTSPSGTVQLGSNLVTTGEMTAKGKNLSTHLHTGVQSGGSTSGPPQ